MSIYTDANVLVTGGTGMIGREVVRLLLWEGAQVRVASLDDARDIHGPRLDYLRGNLIEWEFCQRAVAGMDYVFHVAGIKGSTGIGTTRAASFLIPQLAMNALVMQAAYETGVRRYLSTSSIAVYPSGARFCEDDVWSGPPHPTDRFGAWAKRMSEFQAVAYAAEYGWNRVAIVRPANSYGKYDNFDPATAMVVPALIARAASGENPLVVWGDGSAVRDFIYSADVARGMLLALEDAADGTPINLGSGQGTSIRELVDEIVACFPDPPRIEWDTSKPTGPERRVMDITRARERLDWMPRVSLKDGIRETVRWYVEERDAASHRYDPFHVEEE